MKLPSFQFYPGDWMKDPAVRAVSISARGLWIDLLCMMFESPRRGYLQLATGKPVDARQIARMTGCTTDEASPLLQELEDAGVFSRTEHGVIYSRRLTRDEHIRKVRSDAGKMGAPFGSRGGRPKRAKTANLTANKPLGGGQMKGQNNPPSSSSSISSSTAKQSVPSEQTAALKDFIITQYLKYRGCKLITDGSDWNSFATLLKSCNGSIGHEQLMEAWLVFLKSPDPFHQKQGHPLRFWCSNINAFIGMKSGISKQKDILDLQLEQAEAQHRDNPKTWSADKWELFESVNGKEAVERLRKETEEL